LLLTALQQTHFVIAQNLVGISGDNQQKSEFHIGSLEFREELVIFKKARPVKKSSSGQFPNVICGKPVQYFKLDGPIFHPE